MLAFSHFKARSPNGVLFDKLREFLAIKVLLLIVSSCSVKTKVYFITFILSFTSCSLINPLSLLKYKSIFYFKYKVIIK
jgi:hypothetical protein